MVLRTSVALACRSVNVYERTFTLEEHNTDKIHKRFLNELASILTQGYVPLIVTDTGFKILGSGR